MKRNKNKPSHTSRRKLYREAKQVFYEDNSDPRFLRRLAEGLPVPTKEEMGF